MNLILGVIIVAILLVSSHDLVGTNRINQFYDNAVSCNSGLKEKDRIVKIDGHTVFSERDLSFLMSRSEDGVFDFVVERDGEKLELNDVKFKTEKVKMYPDDPSNDKMITTIIYDFTIVGEQPGFKNIFINSFTQSASIVRMVWLSLFDIVTGRYGMSELSGPVGTVEIIADVTAEAADSGSMDNLLLIMALITINIGIANLLPLPALDGGRLFFLVIEGIRRKKINPKYEGYVHAAGLVLLLMLMVVITFNDILRIVRS